VSTLKGRLNRLRAALSSSEDASHPLQPEEPVLLAHPPPRHASECAHDDATDLTESEALGSPPTRTERISRLRAQMELLRSRDKPARKARSFDAHPATCGDEPLSERTVSEAPEPCAVLVMDDDPLRTASTSALPGAVEQTPFGPLRAVRTVHDEDHRHGQVEVAMALQASPRDLSVLALDPRLETIDLGRALFIDTETTGLSGGRARSLFWLAARGSRDAR
jgi:hypothetical protein